MDIKLSDVEIIYLYGILKSNLSKMEAIKTTSLTKDDTKLHKAIIAKLESAAPQLTTLPLNH